MEIPDDVIMNAERLWDDGGYKFAYEIIAEAIMSERQRCIEIMESRIEIYTDIAQRNAIKECISSVRA